MIIDSNTTKMYFKNISKAILDARNYLFSESEMQDGIDAVYKELSPNYSGKLFLVNSIEGNSAKMMTSQCYIDDVIKPAIKKLNYELSWNLRTREDLIK